jgi:hypothetical protein
MAVAGIGGSPALAGAGAVCAAAVPEAAAVANSMREKKRPTRERGTNSLDGIQCWNVGRTIEVP